MINTLHHVGFILLLCQALGSGHLSADENDPNLWYKRGVDLFYNAKPTEAVAAFDRIITLSPGIKPQLWQRGLALYYTSDFAAGREQFEVHQTVNPRDVENAAWHFICVAKSESLDAARKVFIPIVGDARIPMTQIHALFAGTGDEAAVMAAANDAQASEHDRRNYLCYAHLYLGLYHEALGHTEQAREHMRKAAIDYKMPHYMGRTAQVHFKLRGWDTPPESKTDK